MKKIECKRCGTCCIKGGPVLHTEDLLLIKNKTIRLDQLVVIRKAEPAYNPVSDAVEPASCEMLKLQGKSGSWECLFYDDALKSCTIHDSRPLECRLLQCQDPAALLAVTGIDCLSRQDIIEPNDPAQAYLHEFAECSWEKFNSLLAKPAPHSLQDAEKILRADLFLRQQAIERLQLSLAQELFYFGRPMFQAFSHPNVQLSFEGGMPKLQLQ